MKATSSDTGNPTTWMLIENSRHQGPSRKQLPADESFFILKNPKVSLNWRYQAESLIEGAGRLDERPGLMLGDLPITEKMARCLAMTNYRTP